jgi:hypothetical protein
MVSFKEYLLKKNIMTVKILELIKNSEMGNLSIDKQISIMGGLDPRLNKEFYAQSLLQYARGNFTISSSGDAVSFIDSRDNSLVGTFVIKDNNVLVLASRI